MPKQRILLLYPNERDMSLVPPVIGLFSRLLKDRGHTVSLFDSTGYDFEGKADSDVEAEKNLWNAPIESASSKGIIIKLTNMYDDIVKKVEDFQPTLIAMTVTESTFIRGMELLDYLRFQKKYNILTIVGGVFATFAPERVIMEDAVDIVCIGEGEVAIVELCEKLEKSKNYSKIKNLWVKKKNGEIIKNSPGPAVDVNLLPTIDFTIFEDDRFYRPMRGKVYRMFPVETHRGCPYTCTFCNSPSNNVVYKNETSSKFHRKKSIKRLEKELDFLVKKYDPNLIYFVVDTFLAMSNREFDELKELYSDYKIPFWMNTRAETINEHRAQGLEEMNMLRMNIGIEHGNYKYRREYLKRNVKDEVQIRAFEIASEHKYTSCANSIIGMPDETRGLIFDTINFVRKLPDNIDATGAFIFAPYHGTPLRDLAIKKGYLNEDEICSLSNTSESMLRMPTISKDEIQGLAKVFSFYIKFPEERWKDIKIAEKNDLEGQNMFKELGTEFDEKYRDLARHLTSIDLHD